MLQEYKDREITLDNYGSPRLVDHQSGWELVRVKTYPGSEQMNDFHFFNRREKVAPILVIISSGWGDAQRAQKLGLPYHLGAERRAFRAVHGQTFKVSQLGEKHDFVTEPWPDQQLKSFAELVFIACDRLGWYEDEPIKPDILDFSPVNWDDSLHQKIIHE